jgi:hypothetical protein
MSCAVCFVSVRCGPSQPNVIVMTADRESSIAASVVRSISLIGESLR